MPTWQDDFVPDFDETTPEVTAHSLESTPVADAFAQPAVDLPHEGSLAATPLAGDPADDPAGLASGEPLDARPDTASPLTAQHHDEVLDRAGAAAQQPDAGALEADALDAGDGQSLDAPDHPEVVPAEPTWRRFDLRTQREEGLAAAQQAIAAGECIVLPTDTVYGIGANAFSAEAVQRLLDAKQRGRDMPPPVLISDPMMLQALGADLETYAERLAEECWPGALTLIVTMQPSLRVDLGETRGTIGLRVPDHEETRELLRRTGPLAVSSANVSGRPSSTNIEDAIEQLGNSVSVYLDAGPTPGDAPSTIIDFVSATFGRIVRQGALGLDAIREVDPFVEEYVDPNAVEASPLTDATVTDATASEGTAPDPADDVDAAGNDHAVATHTQLSTEQVATDAAAAQVAEHTDAVTGDHAADAVVDGNDQGDGSSNPSGDGSSNPSGDGDGADRPVH